jgi:cystathionine beta-lyase
MDDVHRVVQDIAGVAVDFGEWFGECSKGFIRINLATIPERVQDVGNRLLNAVKQR